MEGLEAENTARDKVQQSTRAVSTEGAERRHKRERQQHGSGVC